jgi:nicotinamidase/pyrazinamidase
MSALLIIDFQNDFALPTGSLSVPDAEAALPFINLLRFSRTWDAIYLSADWHPEDHCSFQKNNPGTTLFRNFKLPDGTDQIAWPRHCVANTEGAEFHSALERRVTDIRVYKGFNSQKEAYSAFAGRCDVPGITGVPLLYSLKSNGITAVTICGLATDYCVKAAALDAVRLGFATTVVLEACRGVTEQTTATAIKEMVAAGVTIQ